MKKIKIITDTSSDLSLTYYKEHNIDCVSFLVTFNKQDYFKERIDITVEDFYNKLRNEDVYPVTSTPNAQQYKSVFKKALDNDMDIICLCITSKFSASYQSALMAAEETSAEYPDNKIAVIDSIQSCCGQGLVLNELVRMRDKGMALDEIVAKAEECKRSARVFFTVDSLDYLIKGGRVGKTAALAGTILNIKPIIVLKDGELNPVCKVRGRQKSVQKIYEMTAEYIAGEKDKYDLIAVHADCREEAENISRNLINDGYSLPLGVNRAGVTIGAHTGPTFVGVAVIRRISDCV